MSNDATAEPSVPSSGTSGERTFLRVVVVMPLLIVVAAIGALVVAHADLSSSAEMRNDAVFRAKGRDPLVVYRFDDPSGYVQFFPSSIFVHRAWRAGELPLWNPYSGGGFSPVRRYQDAVFHPLRLASLAVPERQAQSFSMLLALALAWSGSVVLLRSLGHRRDTALIFASAFALSSHMCTSIPFEFPMGWALLPWLVMALWSAVNHDQLLGRPTAVAVLVVAVLGIGSHPGVAISVVATASMMVLARLLAAGRLASFPRIFVVGALAIALDAFVLGPFAVELRSAWSYKLETDFGVLYHPFSLEGWTQAVSALVAIGDPPTEGDAFAAWAWLGIPLVVLTVVGLIAAKRGDNWRRALALCAFLFCIPGPWMVWARHVPGLGTIKVWYLFGALPFAAMLLAAVGWEALNGRVAALRAPVIAVAVGVLLGASAPMRAAAWIAPRSGEFLPGSAVLDALRAQPGPVRVTAPPGHAHIENLASVTRVDDVRTHGATLSRRYHTWFDILDPEVQSFAFPSTRVTPLVDHALMRSFGVGYAVEPAVATTAWRSDPLLQPDGSNYLETRRPLELVVDDGFARLWRIPGARARVGGARKLVVVASRADAESALRRMSEPDIDAHDVVEASGDSAGALSSMPPTPAPVEVRAFTRPTSSSLEVEVVAAAPALVVVQELYEEGWTATVDGAPAEVLPVNLVGRGVVVPAGAHKIGMRYWPPGFTLGLVLSLLAAAIVAILWRRRPPR